MRKIESNFSQVVIVVNTVYLSPYNERSAVDRGVGKFVSYHVNFVSCFIYLFIFSLS